MALLAGITGIGMVARFAPGDDAIMAGHTRSRYPAVIHAYIAPVECAVMAHLTRVVGLDVICRLSGGSGTVMACIAGGTHI